VAGSLRPGGRSSQPRSPRHHWQAPRTTPAARRAPWRNGGVPSTTLAAWAGHSVEVLLKTCAKCLNGGDAAVRVRVQVALGTARRRRSGLAAQLGRVFGAED